MRPAVLLATLLAALSAAAQQPADPPRKTVTLDRAHFRKDGDITLEVAHDLARFEWAAGGGKRLALNLSLVPRRSSGSGLLPRSDRCAQRDEESERIDPRGNPHAANAL